ncbi:MAG: T9SS type A sorting domain-containing protein, partial [Candidatus Coatesbacteria bacterium]
YDVQIMYNEPSEGLLEAFTEAAAIYSPTMEIYPVTDRLGGSDHMSFWDNGYRAILAVEHDNSEFYPWYHTIDDLPEHLHFDYGAEVVRCVAATAACLAGISDGPVPGLTDIIAYPNPARPGDAGITFVNLPDNASLALFNVAGERVFERAEITGNETVWTLVNKSGNPVASGIYIYRVTDGEANYVTGKVAVIK